MNKTTIGIVYTGGICPDDGEPMDTRTDEQKETLFELLLIALKRVFPHGSEEYPDTGTIQASGSPVPCFDVDAEFGFLFH